MQHLRRTTAALATSALLAAPLTALASPAVADDDDDDGGRDKSKEFSLAEAEVDFSVEKDDGRFEVEVDIDDARPGTTWKVVLKHNGQRFYKKKLRADDDDDIEVEKERRNTRGKDVFKLKVKKIGGPKKKRKIRMR